MGTQQNIGKEQVLENLVAEHIVANVTRMIEFALQSDDLHAPVQRDTIRNRQCYYDWAGYRYTEAQRQVKLEELTELLLEVRESMNEIPTDVELDAEHTFEEQLEELKNLLPEATEILEWWIVSDWLSGQLLLQGEAMMSDGTNNYWGRGTSGQAIKMDEVIYTIAEETGLIAISEQP